jgi:hypothetical protein
MPLNLVGLTSIAGTNGFKHKTDLLRTHSTVKMILQFERSTRLKAWGLCAMCPLVFFSRFFGIRLVELQIDPKLESTIRTKARGLHSIWNVILRIAFFIWFFIKTSRVLLKTFERSTRRRLGTTREDFNTTQRSVGVPSSPGMIQAFLRTFSLWNSWTFKDYSPRPSRLLEDILLDYKVLVGLSYGHPRAHYPQGYWNRLLRGPPGLLDLGFTVQDGVKHKATRGLVLS